MADQPSIYLTQVDLDRLFDLVETYGPGAGPGADRLQQLESELVRAVVVPRDQIPKDVVTMNSRVVFEDETTGEKREITLVYPKQADIGSGKVSVLVPVGTALLGVRSDSPSTGNCPTASSIATRWWQCPFRATPPTPRRDRPEAALC